MTTEWTTVEASGAEDVTGWTESEIAEQVARLRAAGFTVERDGAYLRVSGEGRVLVRHAGPTISGPVS